MRTNRYSVFKYNVLKSPELIENSDQGHIADSEAVIVLEEETELIAGIRNTPLNERKEIEERLREWIKTNENEINQLLLNLTKIERKLRRTKDKSEIDSILDKESISLSSDKSSFDLLINTLISTLIVNPKHGKRINKISKAYKTLYYLKSIENYPDRKLNYKNLISTYNKTLMVPYGVLPEIKKKIFAKKELQPSKFYAKEEPLSYKIVNKFLEKIDNVHPTKFRIIEKKSSLGEKKKNVEDPRTLVFVLPEEIIDTIPEVLNRQLETLNIDPSTTSISILVDELKKQKRACYQKEKQLLGILPGRRFIPGEWKKGPDDNWNYFTSKGPERHMVMMSMANIGGIIVVHPPQEEPGGDEAEEPTPLESSLRVLGITDLLLVEQQRVCYQAGEIAHIENVLEGEQFNRSHRKFTRMEELFETELEKSEENERDIQSSEKFELERELQQVLKEEQKIDFGAKVSAAYGPTVSVETEFGFENTSSSEQTQRTAQRFESSLTQRAVTRLKERHRELRRMTTITEVEETSEHGITRGTGDGNLSGVYQWVDKVYELQTMNYGKRLMLEAIIPEPGAYLRYLRTQNANAPGIIPPEPFTITFEDVNEDVYADYAATWQVGDIKPPPPEYSVVGFDGKARVSSTGHVHHTGKLKIPEGYKAKVGFSALHRGPDNPLSDMAPIFTIASQTMFQHRNGRYKTFMAIVQDENFYAVGELPFTLGTWYTSAQVKDLPFSITMLCSRTDEKYKKWQIETFNALLQGYLKLKSEYEESISGSGVTIEGNNPTINRDNEEKETRKLCIEAISRIWRSPIPGLHVTTNGDIHLNFSAVDQIALDLRFFEDCFEWKNISYDLYPYYWAGSNHLDLKLLTDPDPSHLSFLRAGAAKIRIPVIPGKERNVLYFFDNNAIFTGEDQPCVDEKWGPLIVDIESFNITQQTSNTPIYYEDPWLVRTPTTFVTLREENGLPEDCIQLSFTEVQDTDTVDSGSTDTDAEDTDPTDIDAEDTDPTDIDAEDIDPTDIDAEDTDPTDIDAEDTDTTDT